MVESLRQIRGNCGLVHRRPNIWRWTNDTLRVYTDNLASKLLMFCRGRNGSNGGNRLGEGLE